jgi:molybdopterin-guanine dinucleotide biosynthesis protein A
MDSASRGAIVLAGGPSERLGRPKALVRFGGVPLVLRAASAAFAVSEDVVVVSRGPLAGQIQEILFAGPRVVRDQMRARSPLVGLLAGAEALRTETVAAIACDLPFIRPSLLSRLFREARGHDAAVPRWPDGRVEPLVAVYRRVALLRALRSSLAAGDRSNLAMLARLRDVRFVPVGSLRSLDPGLRSFVNVNTPRDLARARRLAPRS